MGNYNANMELGGMLEFGKCYFGPDGELTAAPD
jgi:hypothetical protein